LKCLLNNIQNLKNHSLATTNKIEVLKLAGFKVCGLNVASFEVRCRNIQALQDHQ
jgi:hypothetical protein